MSLIRSMAEGFMRLRADVSGAPAPWDDFWYERIGSGSSTGMRLTADTVKRIAAVLACVSIIGRTVAMLPLKIYQEEADGGKHAAPKHPLFDVLYSTPNQQQTAFEFRQMMQGHLELRGNAYAEIVPGPRGAVDQLIPMHPDRVTVFRGSNGRLKYRYNDPLTNIDRYLLQEEVFHLRNYSDDGVTGQSTVQMAADTFGTALAAQEYSARFFQNDAKPGGIIEGARFKTKADEEAFRESWQKSQTAANRHKTAVLPPGLTYKEIGVKPSDAQLLDSRKFSRIEISSIFGVPPHLIGETEKTATYASVEQFAIMFAVQCITPRLVNWEQTITRDLLFGDDPATFFPKFSMAALLRGDTAARYGAYQIAIQNGWLSQNDVRILEDLNPVKDGDNYWRPMNWAKLGDAVEEPNTTADPSAGNTDLGESGDQQALATRTKMLATSLATAAAQRCVRKEIGSVKKLLERGVKGEELREFYAQHAGWIAETLRMTPGKAKAYCDSRCAYMEMLAREGSLVGEAFNGDAAQVQQLTELATEGMPMATEPMQITVNPAPITLRPTIHVQPPTTRRIVKLIKTPDGLTTGAEISEA